MILKPSLARAVATGRTTTLVIPAHRGRAGAPWRPCPWKLDREYSIPTPLTPTERAQITNGDTPQPPPLGHVRIAAIGAPRNEPTAMVRHEQPIPLTVTLDLAAAAGYDSIDAFKRAWVHEHDTAWLERHAPDLRWARSHDDWTRKWGRSQHAESHILLMRFAARWNLRPVWVVRFNVISDVRYLATPDPTRGQGDYTRTPSQAIDPLPTVDGATQERYSKAALGFCVGKQLERAREAQQARANGPRQAKRNARIAMFKDAA